MFCLYLEDHRITCDLAVDDDEKMLSKWGEEINVHSKIGASL